MANIIVFEIEKSAIYVAYKSTTNRLLKGVYQVDIILVDFSL